MSNISTLCARRSKRQRSIAPPELALSFRKGSRFLWEYCYKAFLDALANHIRGRLKLRKFCLVFQNELDRVWPRAALTPQERDKLIHAFAKANQWEARIYDPGIRVSFRPLTP